MNANRAVFLDRDGTINIESHYLIDPADFRFIPGAPHSLKQLQNAGFLLVVITNQSGIARGYFSQEQVDRLHEHMKALLAEHGVQLAGIYICPHHPEAGTGEYRQHCDCRKGKPGNLLRAAEDLDIDLSRSYMIGDKLEDIAAGFAAGCSPVLVKTGYGNRALEQAEAMGAQVTEDLNSAAQFILSRLELEQGSDSPGIS